MSDPQDHITRIRKEFNELQTHGHIVDGACFTAYTDMELSLYELEQALVWAGMKKPKSI